MTEILKPMFPLLRHISSFPDFRPLPLVASCRHTYMSAVYFVKSRENVFLIEKADRRGWFLLGNKFV